MMARTRWQAAACILPMVGIIVWSPVEAGAQAVTGTWNATWAQAVRTQDGELLEIVSAFPAAQRRRAPSSVPGGGHLAIEPAG